MPVGPFRTHTQGVNVRDLERVFDAGAEVTPEALKAQAPDPHDADRREDPRPGRPDEEAHRFRPRRLAVGAREDRGRRRQRHAPARAEGAQAQAAQEGSAPVEAEAETQVAEESEEAAEESAEPEPEAEAEPEPDEE